MERVVYSPSVDLLGEAENLAKITLLPILIGESEATKLLNFDRQEVQVLKIPKIYFFGLNTENINKGFHQSVLLIDEFTLEPISGYSLIFNDKIQIPIYSEKYKVKWSFQCFIEGINKVSLFLQDKQISEVEFNVH